MATLSSMPTKNPRPLPWNFDFTENLNNHQQKTLLKLHKGYVETSSPFPIRGVAPLPCKSSLQSKHDIARRSNGRKGETFETIVGSCISRAVAFSNRQLKAILKSFSDSSANQSTSSRDLRCHSAEETYSNGPENNGNGVGGSGCGNEGGDGGSGSQGGDSGRSGGVMGVNWWRRRSRQCSTCGRSALIRVANQTQVHDATTHISDLWTLWAVVEVMLGVAIAPVSIGIVIRPAVELFLLFSLIFSSLDSLLLTLVVGYSVAGFFGLLLLLFALFGMKRR